MKQVHEIPMEYNEAYAVFFKMLRGWACQPKKEDQKK